MAKIDPLGAIEGVEDFNTLVTFLGDKDAYAARLKALTDLHEAINAKIEMVGQAEEITSLQVQAQSDRQMAGESLATAKKQAADLLADARTDYAKSMSEIARQRQDLSQRESDLVKASALQGAAMDERERAAAEVMQAGRVMQAEAETALQRAEAVREEFQGKLAKLTAGLAAVSG